MRFLMLVFMLANTGCGGAATPPGDSFDSWTEYATAYCQDVQYRLPRLASELHKADNKKKNWGAVGTTAITITGTTVSVLLTANDQDTEAIVASVASGILTVASAVVTAIVGDGPSEEIDDARAKEVQIKTSLKEHNRDCPIGNTRTAECKAKAKQLARLCNTLRDSAALRQGRFSSPDTVQIRREPTAEISPPTSDPAPDGAN